MRNPPNEEQEKITLAKIKKKQPNLLVFSFGKK